jgi:hypothetical protein|nr:hypothetical protein [uncultured Pseudoxanthomonas sp.]
MPNITRRAGIALLVALCAMPCGAQDAQPSAPDSVASAAGSPPSPPCCELAEGTPLVLEILDPISSASVKRGDAFRLRVRDAITVGGSVVIAAGTEGVGEVVHAEPSRGGGKPGELILAARRLQVGDREVKLRGFKLGGAGTDTSHVALGASFGIGPFAHFIHGKEIQIPALTSGMAKLAEPLRSPPLPEAPPALGASATPGDDTTPEPAPAAPTATPPNHLE